MRRNLQAVGADQTVGPLNRPRSPRPTGSGILERSGEQAGVVGRQLATARCRGADVPAGTVRPVARVDEQACTPCGACQAVCPTEAIALGEVAVRVNAELCRGCGACVEACPSGAIRLN
ncbi:MAG: 4Fe-4S binding protein [Phycisphaerae bacterium]|nr:4Fe-4S binding protein [Phycisphaerae bacterium]